MYVVLRAHAVGRHRRAACPTVVTRTAGRLQSRPSHSSKSNRKLPEMSCTCKHCGAVLKDIRIAREHHARCPRVQGLQCSLLKGAACDDCFTIASAAIRFNELVPIKALDLSKSSHEAQVCRFFGLDFLFFNVLSCIRSLLLK
jgi:hypothetical protein